MHINENQLQSLIQQALLDTLKNKVKQITSKFSPSEALKKLGGKEGLYKILTPKILDAFNKHIGESLTVDDIITSLENLNLLTEQDYYADPKVAPGLATVLLPIMAASGYVGLTGGGINAILTGVGALAALLGAVAVDHLRKSKQENQNESYNMKITLKQLKQLIRESIEEMRRDNPLHRVRLDLGADIRKEVELKSLVRSEIRRTLRENFDSAGYIAGRVEDDPSPEMLAQLYPTEDRGAHTEPSSGQPIGGANPEDIDAYANNAAKLAAYSWNESNYQLHHDLLNNWAQTGEAKNWEGKKIEKYKDWNKEDWEKVRNKFEEKYTELLKDPKSIDMRERGADASPKKNPFIPESKTSLQEVMNELFER